MPDDCGIAVNGVLMSEFLAQNKDRCMQPMPAVHKDRPVYLVEVQGLPEIPGPKDWTKKATTVKEQLKLRLWLDPNNRLMPVKIEQGKIVYLPAGTVHESFPHYVIEPMTFLSTKNGAWVPKETRITQLAAWPWGLTSEDRETVLSETVLESNDLAINEGISDELFQTRLTPDTVVTDAATGESLPNSGVLPRPSDKSEVTGDEGTKAEANGE